MAWNHSIQRLLLTAAVLGVVLSTEISRIGHMQTNRFIDSSPDVDIAMVRVLASPEVSIEEEDVENEQEVSVLPHPTDDSGFDETSASLDDEVKNVTSLPASNPTLSELDAVEETSPIPSNEVGISTINMGDKDKHSKAESDIAPSDEPNEPIENKGEHDQEEENAKLVPDGESENEEVQVNFAEVTESVSPSIPLHNDDGVNVPNVSGTSNTSEVELTELPEGESHILPSPSSETYTDSGSSSVEELLPFIPKSPGQSSHTPVVDNQHEMTSEYAPSIPATPSTDGEASNLAPTAGLDPYEEEENHAPSATGIGEDIALVPVPMPSIPPHRKDGNQNNRGSKKGTKRGVEDAIPWYAAGDKSHQSDANSSSGNPNILDKPVGPVPSAGTSSSEGDENTLASKGPIVVIGPILQEDMSPIVTEEPLHYESNPDTPSPSLEGLFDSFDMNFGFLDNTREPEPSESEPFAPGSSEGPDSFDSTIPLPEPVVNTPLFTPEAEAEPSAAPENLLVQLFVNHPNSFQFEELSEDIRDISNEFIEPEDWEVVHTIPLSKFSKFSSLPTDVHQTETDSERNTFEIALRAICSSGSSCTGVIDSYHGFVRDMRMDKALAQHDFGQVNVFVKGDKMNERGDATNAEAGVGLGAGVIAGIAVGAIALVSVLLLGAVLVVKRKRRYDRDFDGPDDFGDEVEHGYRQSNDQDPPPDESFLISNFGGSIPNASGMVPWTSNSDRSVSGPAALNADSFISVDTDASGESGGDHGSGYRFDETTSSSSGSEVDIDVDGRASQ